MAEETQLYYKIIWTRDDVLDVACMQWFDEADYHIAYEKRFDTEDEAQLKCQQLASHVDSNFNREAIEGLVNALENLVTEMDDVRGVKMRDYKLMAFILADLMIKKYKGMVSD